jgi:hypothetical protein
MSSNDPRVSTIDAVVTKAKAKKSWPAEERLAHGAHSRHAASTLTVRTNEPRARRGRG